MKHSGKMLYDREKLNMPVREGKIESLHSNKNFKGIGTRSNDLEAEIRMHSLTVDCDTV